jgi:hypothetical protein
MPMTTSEAATAKVRKISSAAKGLIPRRLIAAMKAM